MGYPTESFVDSNLLSHTRMLRAAIALTRPAPLTVFPSGRNRCVGPEIAGQHKCANGT